MGNLRRGFKAEAERLVVAVRQKLGLKVTDRLDCNILAAELGIAVFSLLHMVKFGASRASVARLSRGGTEFSAMTVCAGTSRLIVYNPSHPPGRRANSLAHELSHILLEHSPAPALAAGGCRFWDSIYEAEADWLAGCLLVPREGALLLLLRNRSFAASAAHFGVSRQLFRWRANQTGVVRQLGFMSRRSNRARTLRG